MKLILSLALAFIKLSPAFLIVAVLALLIALLSDYSSAFDYSSHFENQYRKRDAISHQ